MYMHAPRPMCSKKKCMHGLNKPMNEVAKKPKFYKMKSCGIGSKLSCKHKVVVVFFPFFFTRRSSRKTMPRWRRRGGLTGCSTSSQPRHALHTCRGWHSSRATNQIVLYRSLVWGWVGASRWHECAFRSRLARLGAVWSCCFFFGKRDKIKWLHQLSQ